MGKASSRPLSAQSAAEYSKYNDGAPYWSSEPNGEAKIHVAF